MHGRFKGEKKSTEAVTAKELMADILGIDFKTIILKMLKELKKMQSKLKTNKQTHTNGKINKEKI